MPIRLEMRRGHVAQADDANADRVSSFEFRIQSSMRGLLGARTGFRVLEVTLAFQLSRCPIQMVCRVSILTRAAQFYAFQSLGKIHKSAGLRLQTLQQL